MKQYKDLTDYAVLNMYEKAIIEWRQRPRIMPFEESNNLIQRKVGLRNELARRKLILL
tara:strand:- start:390 stop:563 length:174 start_codon:yes stop_codon:yes gene_type:complete